MILSSFGYKENGWELSEFTPLKPVNLLVAKNATGKTRTIQAIQNVTSFMRSKENLLSQRSFEAFMTFKSSEDSEWTMEYSIKVNKGLVEKERLSVGGVSLITRTTSIARYESTKIDPPADKLVTQIRRDKSLYPEIEKLMTWAEGVTSVYCSDINTYTILGVGKIINPYSFSDLIDQLSPKEVKDLLLQAKKLGYNIADLKTFEAFGVKMVHLKERLVLKKLADIQLSSGMLRVLYLLSFVAVIKQNKKLSMLLLDDLGEGLDYRRSVELGKLLFDDCASQNVQLIASSNDSFLMDVIDVADWQVLRRKGSKVTSINQSNNPGLFRNFKMTGLSNFDLFSSDFIERYNSKVKGIDA